MFVFRVGRGLTSPVPLWKSSKCLVFSRLCSSDTPSPLRARKHKSQRKETLQHFVDSACVRTVGGKGGDGCVSFLSLWSNDHAGPDGGDGGSGGHVLLEANSNVHDLRQVQSVVAGDAGEKGHNKDCHGSNADHTIIKVPIGTIVKSKSGIVVGDLSEENTLFIAARGGAGGKGNHFFMTDTNQAPRVAEFGADGEDNSYSLEMSSMANVGLIGFPNAGKSTLLQAISRARPKVAPYPFTTLHPHLGVVAYDDQEQVAVADLPGLIPDSHRNKGLGIEFLRHAERCSVLLFLLDASLDEPWEALYILRNEIEHFNPNMLKRPSLVVANKIDLPSAQQNLPLLKSNIEEPVIGISAKQGTNLIALLRSIRELHDKYKKDKDNRENLNCGMAATTEG